MLELGRHVAAHGGAAQQRGDEWIIDAGTRFELQQGPHVLVFSYARFFPDLPATLELVNVYTGTATPMLAPSE